MAVAAPKAPAVSAIDRGPLLDLIAVVVPDSAAWLNSANTALDGLAPCELLGTPREDRLRELVLAYKYGVFA